MFDFASRFTVIGEDTSDLLESIQNTFDIRFTADDCLPETVGKLCDLVKNRLRGTKPSRCMSSVVFYSVRRTMIEVTGSRVEEILPAARLESLLSSGRKRRKEWDAMGTQIGLELPKLAFSSRMEACLAIAHITPAVALIVLIASKLRFDAGIWLLILFMIAAGTLIVWVGTRSKLQSVATNLPRRCDTVRGLVKSIVSRNFGILCAGIGGWNDREVWEALRQLIADETSTNLEKIMPDTPFPDGLGIF